MRVPCFCVSCGTFEVILFFYFKNIEFFIEGFHKFFDKTV